MQTGFVLSFLVSIISYNWGLLFPCSTSFNGSSPIRHRLLFELLKSHSWTEPEGCRDLSFFEEGKLSLQNLRGDQQSIGQCWSRHLELRKISPISAEILQITEIRPLASESCMHFRECSKQLLTHEGQIHLAEAVGFAQSNRTLGCVFGLYDHLFVMLGNMHRLS